MMTSVSNSAISSTASRKVTQAESSNGMQGRHDLAVGGNTMPGRKTGDHHVEAVNSEIALEQAVQNATSYAKKIGRELDFTIDKELNRTIVTVLDGETGAIIRQVPMEEMLALAKILSDVQAPGDDTVLKGLFLDQDT